MGLETPTFWSVNLELYPLGHHCPQFYSQWNWWRRLFSKRPYLSWFSDFGGWEVVSYRIYAFNLVTIKITAWDLHLHFCTHQRARLLWVGLLRSWKKKLPSGWKCFNIKGKLGIMCIIDFPLTVVVNTNHASNPNIIMFFYETIYLHVSPSTTSPSVKSGFNQWRLKHLTWCHHYHASLRGRHSQGAKDFHGCLELTRSFLQNRNGILYGLSFFYIIIHVSYSWPGIPRSSIFCWKVCRLGYFS